jgi:GrpB-like predicted nucleotidyltransferase (UPF0157 family)
VDEIHVVDYDPRWPALFEAEAARVRDALGTMIRRMEHIGSTAVPGLDARPIIDIQIGVESVDKALHEAVPPLEAMGYSYWADKSHQEHLILVRGLRRTALARIIFTLSVWIALTGSACCSAIICAPTLTKRRAMWH